ncbi:hypothetical protein [Streptomyces sp. NPDC005805]|uniref:hypothetical protein n=1 Tax=Streptomyces sp. NPDC005805 TaxID=3157068 RepID=UPI0033D174C3
MASTTAPARRQRVRPTTDPAPTAPPPVAPSPIYDQLAREWAAAGRTLPGRPDGEWKWLTLYPPASGPAPAAPDDLLDAIPSPPPRRGWLHDHNRVSA